MAAFGGGLTIKESMSYTIEKQDKETWDRAFGLKEKAAFEADSDESASETFKQRVKRCLSAGS